LSAQWSRASPYSSAARPSNDIALPGESGPVFLPDFFIGAHAVISDSLLITRDAARYRTYFPGIMLIAPN
jgi:predicted nucleic acid-binding protein